MTDALLALVGNAKAGTISVVAVDDDHLRVVGTSEVGAGCSTFAVDAARNRVYTAVKEPSPGIVTLELDRLTGTLSELSRAEVPDALAYLILARGGELLLGASYGGGWGATWPVTDGVVGERSKPVQHRNVHCVVTDAAGQHAYFVALGDDLVAQCAISRDGALAPLEPPTVGLDADAGPRHLILSFDETSAYLMTEFTGEAIRFDRDTETGTLTRAESVRAHATDRGLSDSELGADPKEGHLVWGADLHLAREEAYLVCSERTESTLAAVRLDADGHLGEVVALAETQTQPRGFNVTPDGAQLLVAGEASGRVSLVGISLDGRLTELDQVATGEGPNWVRFV